MAFLRTESDDAESDDGVKFPVKNKLDFSGQVGRIKSEYDELHGSRYRNEYAFLRPHGGSGEFEDGVCMCVMGRAIVERAIVERVMGCAIVERAIVGIMEGTSLEG